MTKFLKKVSSTHIEIKKIVTSGDENQNDRLSNIGGKGLFSKKIETELKNKLPEAEDLKEILKIFNDNEFIISKKNGYQIK